MVCQSGELKEVSCRGDPIEVTPEKLAKGSAREVSPKEMAPERFARGVS